MPLFTLPALVYAGNQPSDPSYATATYAVLDSETFSLSRQLTLTILLETWPINTYPFLTLLPSGSTLIVAGERPTPQLLHALQNVAEHEALHAVIQVHCSSACSQTACLFHLRQLLLWSLVPCNCISLT